MDEDNEIKEVMDEGEEDNLNSKPYPWEEEEHKVNTPWTSVDLYYKGVHIKKSIPSNIKVEKLKETIDMYLEAGFKPSWNTETNGKHEQPTLLQRPCSHEGCQGTQSFRQGISKKTGKPWKAWFCDLVKEHGDFV